MKIMILRAKVMYWRFRRSVCRFRRKCVNIEAFVIDKIIDFNNMLIRSLNKS